MITLHAVEETSSGFERRRTMSLDVVLLTGRLDNLKWRLVELSLDAKPLKPVSRNVDGFRGADKVFLSADDGKDAALLAIEVGKTYLLEGVFPGSLNWGNPGGWV